MATLEIDGWAGRNHIPIEIVGETPTKYRVKLLVDTRLPGRWREGHAGDVILAPKYAIKGR